VYPPVDTEIIDYCRRYADAFAALNIEWLEKYFVVEPIDRDILGDPERSILASGGAILFARKGEKIVGTVALKHQGAGVYELTKMAVTERCQGTGIGRLLLAAAIRRFETLGGDRLYLESHSSLGAALALYEASGFVHTAPPAPSDYERADVYMVYRPG
jgi:putative acetyltransferase